jgi:hypothetical protein
MGGTSDVFAPGHLGELTQVVPPELVDAVLEETGAREWRLRCLPSRVGVCFVLALGLFEHLGARLVWTKLVSGLTALQQAGHRRADLLVGQRPVVTEWLVEGPLEVVAVTWPGFREPREGVSDCHANAIHSVYTCGRVACPERSDSLHSRGRPAPARRAVRIWPMIPGGDPAGSVRDNRFWRTFCLCLVGSTGGEGPPSTAAEGNRVEAEGSLKRVMARRARAFLAAPDVSRATRR